MNNVQKSYDAHQNWAKVQMTDEEQEQFITDLYNQNNVNINRTFRAKLWFNHLNLLLKKADKWLTVGDCYGSDAKQISQLCDNVTACDIHDDYLVKAHKKGLITSYSRQNAESMTFNDSAFDYILCRDTYHHFPRPYIAVYEMLRCAKKAVVIQEPVDPLLKMPLLLFLCNIFDTKKNPIRSFKFWKNRFSFETVGNYVYKISQREVEKIAMGIGLPAVAFYYFNDVFEAPNLQSYKRKLKFKNILCRLKIKPYQKVSAILFNQLPDEETKQALKKQGYYYYQLPTNPYL